MTVAARYSLPVPSAIRALVSAILFAAGPVALATAAPDPATVASGDAAWDDRARGAADGWASPGPVDEALGAYEAAWKASPGAPEVAWRLARALWFRAEYATRDDGERRRLLDRAIRVVEEGLDRLAAVHGGRKTLEELAPEERARSLWDEENATPLYHWAAISWGVWGEASGKVAAARQGVGSRIRDYSETVIALDPAYDHAGGHRVLGRLHAEAPKIPFFTGWVDRDRAVTELEKATRLAPDHLFNPLYLAEALLTHRKAEAPRARRLLEEIARARPSPEFLVEETRILLEAKRLLGG